VRARAWRRWAFRAGRLLWTAFLVLDVPLLLAVALGLAARDLHPGPVWWVQFFGVLLPYLTWFLGVAALGPLLARRWGWFALHLVFLGLVAWRAFPPERLAGGPAPAADDLVLMSFNVPQSGPSRDALRDSLVTLVARERPDVLALQEVWALPGRRRPLRDAPHAEAVVERLPYVPATFPRPRPEDPRPMRSTVVPVLVRDRADTLAVLEQRVLPLGTGAEEDRPSSATRTRFRWQGREGVLYNVHLRSFGDDKPWEDRIRLLEPATWLPYLRQYRDAFRARAADVDQLTAFVEAETLPVLVVGDLNGTADNWTYEALRGGRRDAYLTAGAGAGHTYRADKPLVRIDFVLADRAWDVTMARVLDVGFSEHRPLVVGLRWAEEDVP
jgi:endonuclease/exonuclease/phosphatase family metal-dependent hydrolase